MKTRNPNNCPCSEPPRARSRLEGQTPTICTIGYTQQPLERFVQLLQESHIDVVVDVRLRNTSQLAGLGKRDDLAVLLRQGFHIEYEHCPELAPTSEIMSTYKADRDGAAYEQDSHPLLTERDATTIGRELLVRYHQPCLLCTEPSPDRCHRRLVAEWWAEHLPNVEVRHLT
jgi:uncharacterized protein (DUF488 family)